MTAVLVQPTIMVRPPVPAEATTVEVVEQLDSLVESAMCACSAGDDNPY